MLSPDARADPHGFAGMLSREPWRNRGGVLVSCRRRPSWGGNGRWRLSAGGARGRREPVARVPFDCLSLARSANGAGAFPQMTGEACRGPSSRVPCACGCLLRGCLYVAGGLSGRQWREVGGLMFLAGCPDSRGLVRCGLLLARAERRKKKEMPMTRFIQQSACEGRRPHGVVPDRLRSRPRLLSRLLEDRGALRLIVAPPGFGKATLAFDTHL